MDDSEEQVREVQKAIHDREKDADQMEKHAGELNSEIDSVRQEFQRRRNDDNVSGLPPEPEAAEEKAGETPESTSPASEEPAGNTDEK